MPLENENAVKKLVGMLIEVLHGDYSDTRDLAVVQLAIIGEKAVPYISAYLEELADKVNEMIKYDELYTDFTNKRDKFREAERNSVARVLAKFQFEAERAENALTEYATVLNAKWGIANSSNWRAGWRITNHLSEREQIARERDKDIREWIKVEHEGIPSHRFRKGATGQIVEGARRQAVEGVLKALSIIGDRRVIPLLQRLPIYQFHYEYEDDYFFQFPSGDKFEGDRPPLFEKVKETIDIILNHQ